MVYQYVGYTREDKNAVKGTVSASSEEIARQILASRGYRVVSLKPRSSFIPNWKRLYPVLSQPKTEEIVLLSRQLASLLEAGIDIVISLELLQAEASNKILKRTLGKIISDLRGGNKLSTAMAKHQRIFPPIFRRSLAVGEQTGIMETVLRQVADYLEREDTTAKEVKNALRYPIIISIVAIIMIGVLVTFVFPVFIDMYSMLGAELPLLTRMLIAAVDGLKRYGLYLLAGAGLIGVLAFAFIKRPAGRYIWDRLLLRLPLVGRVIHLNELARCCRSMSLLFHAGLPLPEIMSIVIQSSNNKAIAKALSYVQRDMLQGEGLSQPMTHSRLFLPIMVQMVGIGEETGNLDATLLSVAQTYETKVKDRINSLMALIQPVMTLIIGLVVAFIALSLFSAMFSMYGQLPE